MECCMCNLLAIAAVIAAVIIGFFKWNFQFFKKLNIPYPKPRIPWGNFSNSFKPERAMYEDITVYYKEFKKKERSTLIQGLFFNSSPVYIPVDTDLIKNILTKDFQFFFDRNTYVNEADDPLSVHLFNLEGAKWRAVRQKLTPTFTSGKMKMMFPTLLQVGVQLKEEILKQTIEKTPLDIKEILGRFSTDVIGSCAFGIDCNSFTEPNSDFRKYGKRVFQPTALDNVIQAVCLTWPDLARKLRLSQFPKTVTKFFMKMVKDTVNYREENDFTRKDFMQLLIELKNEQCANPLNMNDVAAQAFLFFLAGFETSSTTMTYCLFELAQNRDIQQKCREEIEEVMAKHGGELTYDGLAEMKYLSRVIDETLRKYPPAGFLIRKCTQDYKVLDTGVELPKGTNVFIPVHGLHHDSEYYPNPEKFDPDRFTDKEKAKREQKFCYLPFGEGPRNCIGLRFGVMQSKVGLSIILKNFKLSLNKNTKLPIQQDPYTLIISTKDPIWLDSAKV